MVNKISFSLALLAVTLLSSCELIEGIFKAGVYTALIGIVVIVAIIIWIFSKFRGR